MSIFFLPFSIPRKFDADYLEKSSNPYKDKYVAAMQLLFSTYGDQEVMFADYMNKVNRVGKAQRRGIVVTDKNIYKHDPKNYKVKKFGTPIIEIVGI
jgi:myosin-1